MQKFIPNQNQSSWPTPLSVVVFATGVYIYTVLMWSLSGRLVLVGTWAEILFSEQEERCLLQTTSLHPLNYQSDQTFNRQKSANHKPSTTHGAARTFDSADVVFCRTHSMIPKRALTVCLTAQYRDLCVFFSDLAVKVWWKEVQSAAHHSTISINWKTTTKHVCRICAVIAFRYAKGQGLVRKSDLCKDFGLVQAQCECHNYCMFLCLFCQLELWQTM